VAEEFFAKVVGLAAISFVSPNRLIIRQGTHWTVRLTDSAWEVFV
jgi:hypothetical protein